MAHSTASLKNSLVLYPENLGTGGCILLPSQISASDLPRLLAALNGREVGFLIGAAEETDRTLRDAVQATGLTQIDLQNDEAEIAAAEAVGRGSVLIFVPQSSQCQPATSIRVPRAALERVVSLRQPIQPVFIEHPRDSRLKVDSPSGFPDITLVFALRLEGPRITLGNVWEQLLLGASVAFEKHRTFRGNLVRYVIQGIKHFGGKAKIIDGTDGSETSYHKILAAAIVLSQEIRKATRASRIGIVLPPGKGALIANLAALLAGKTPVNLNFTAGKEAVESCIKQGEIDRYLTADVFVRKMQTFPWPPLKNLIFIERVLPQLKGRILRWLLAVKFLPTAVLSAMLKVPGEGGDSEAVLLFTSGSSGDPKGVQLSHTNVLANVNQFAARLNLGPGNKILACLPLFHSFGCTVTLWYPLIEGLSIVTYPTPLESPKLAELVEKYQVDLLLATPTFLRGYLRRVKREQLASLKLIVTGAEKLPVTLEEEFRKRFGKPVMEGYGLTETSPATNVNLPDLEPTGGMAVIPSRRLGSVGQMLPGIAVKITDPSTDQPLSVDQSGMIWLRGANIFRGYLKQPRKTEEVLRDGWFRTGDIGRLDGDGFLYIEGRLSRFSKIGGEMVPHETVEEHINKALGLDSETERKIAVVGVPDPDKGEALVLLSTVASEAVKQELINLRYTLLDRGVPSLWIPKRLVPVPQIPILQSGKLDLKGCEKLANRTDA